MKHTINDTRRIRGIAAQLPMLLLLVMGILLSKAALADSTGHYVHNAGGGLRVGVAFGNRSKVLFEDSTVLKNALDVGWSRARAEATERVAQQIRAQASQLDEVTVELADSDMTELRVMGMNEGLALKYVLHENKVWGTASTPWPLPNVSFVVNFDVEIVVAVQASSGASPFEVADASAYVRNAKIDGDGLAGDLAKPVIDTFFYNMQELEAQINGTVFPFKEELVGRLKSVMSLLERIPVDILHMSTDVDPSSGKVSVCLKINPAAQCEFPASYEEQHVRSTLDTSIDRCSRPVVWIWDVEKGEYIPIRKGAQGVEIEVNWEFHWYCGWEEDRGTEERAAGPKETSAVRVSRELDGRRIDWQFL